jgi:thioredoxin 1
MKAPLVGLLLVMGFVGCGSDEEEAVPERGRTTTAVASSNSPSASSTTTSLLFTQSASSGTFGPEDGGRRELTLRGVSPETVWFEDRPGRRAGQRATGAFVRDWAQMGFVKDAPNAALDVLSATDEANTVVVELIGRPRYDAARRTLRYSVRVLDDQTGPGGLRADPTVPRTFDAASLFIDNSPPDDDPFVPVADDSFRRLVLENPEPILVSFWAPWAGEARLAESELYDYTDQDDALAVYRLDVDANPDTTRNYGVRSVPTLMLFIDGKPVRTWVGITRSSQITEQVEAALEAAGKR